MSNLENLCEAVNEYYKNDSLEPGVLVSKTRRGWYCAVHTFPKGLKTRKVVIRSIQPTLEEAVAEATKRWVTLVMPALGKLISL